MKNEMKFSGIVTAISEPKNGSGANGAWENVTVTVTEEVDKYPQSIAVDCFNKQDEVAKIKVGSICEVLFNVEAKEYNGRVYGSNKLWKFDKVQSAQSNIPIVSPTAVSQADTDVPF